MGRDLGLPSESEGIFPMPLQREVNIEHMN